MVAVIERPDGTTYRQLYSDDFYALLDLKESIGPEYWIVDLIDTDIVSERENLNYDFSLLRNL